jgi:MFS family permease
LPDSVENPDPANFSASPQENCNVLAGSRFNAARIIGPSLAGFMIAKLGIAPCFYINAVSFVPVIAGIVMIRIIEPPVSLPTIPENRNIRLEIKEGLLYVVKTPVILIIMTLLAVVNIFAFNFNVLIPLYARSVFKIGAQGFGVLMATNGIGAVLGSIILAAHSGDKRQQPKRIVLAAGCMCIFELLMVPVHSQLLAILLLALVGFSMIAFTTSVNSLIQVQTLDNIRGRVMSIYTLVFMGLSPIGNFFSGWAAHIWNAPVSLGLGAVISLGFIILLIIRYPRNLFS